MSPKPPASETNLPPEDWSPAEVLAALNKQGLNLARLARSLGVKPTTAYQVLRLPYPKMERAIAEAIGVPPETIWPRRYLRRELLRRAQELAA